MGNILYFISCKVTTYIYLFHLVNLELEEFDLGSYSFMKTTVNIGIKNVLPGVYMFLMA